MSFKAAKCPSCQGALQVPDDMDSVKCMYCGVNVMVRQAIQLATGKIKESTNTTPIMKARKDIFAGVIFILFGLLFLATENILGAALGLCCLGMAIFLIFNDGDEEIGFTGECPYCSTHLSILYGSASSLLNRFTSLSPSLNANGKIIGITCTACQNRIVVRDNKLFSIDTTVSGAQKTN